MSWYPRGRRNAAAAMISGLRYFAGGLMLTRYVRTADAWEHRPVAHCTVRCVYFTFPLLRSGKH